MPLEVPRDVQRVGRRGAHARIQGSHAAQQKPALERAEHGAEALADTLDPVPMVVGGGGDQRAGDHVAVPVQVLGAGMHNIVGAERQRAGDHRAGRSAVHGQPRPGGVGDVRRRLDVGYVPHRVARRFDPDQRRPARPDGLRQGVHVGARHELDVQPPRLGEVDQPVAERPVHHAGRHHMVTRLQGHEQRRRRRHAGGEDQSPLPAFQPVKQRLDLVVSRVVGTAVDAPVGVVAVVGVPQIGGAGMDRRHDRAGVRVDPAQGVGGKGFGFQAVGLAGHRGELLVFSGYREKAECRARRPGIPSCRVSRSVSWSGSR